MTDILSFVADYLDVEADTLRLESHGGDYRLYSTTGEEQFIVRVSKSDDQQMISDRFRSEAEMIKTVSQNTDLPVPTIHGWLTDMDQPFDVLIMSRMQGISLHESWSYLDRDQRKEIAVQLANMLNQLHEVPMHGFGSPVAPQASWPDLLISRITYGLNRLVDHSFPRPLGREVLVNLESWAPSIPELPPTAVHGDLNDHNLLVSNIDASPKISGIIDWEWGMGGAPGYDLTFIESLFQNQYSIISTFHRVYYHSLDPATWEAQRKVYLLDRYIQSAMYYLSTDRYTRQRQHLSRFTIQSLLS